MARRPNILFITCDQWRGECLGAAGHPTLKTPHADALAREGVLFRRHYAGAAPCSPARACIYTGLFQMNNRVCRNGTPMDFRHDNLARAARRLGYDPTLFGYTDVSPDPRRHALNDPLLKSYEGVLPGFTVRRLLPEHQKPWLSWLRQRGVETGSGFPQIHRAQGYKGKGVSNAAPVYNADETPTAYLAGEFLQWLDEQDRAQPWFAHLSFISPHPPFVVPEPYNSMYDPADGPAFCRAESWRAESETHPYVAYELGRQKRGKFVIGAKGIVRDWSEDEFRAVRALYYGMISELDAQLGRIWQGLREAGTWQDTVIVLTSDHAEMMGDHFMLGKGGFHDGSFHLPLIIRDPRRKASGETVDRFTLAVDLMPTLIELMGGEAPAYLDGTSLTPWLSRRKPLAWRDAAFWEYDFRGISSGRAESHFGIGSRDCNLTVLRTETHKYVHFGGSLPPLLFDLEADPMELENRAEDPSMTALRLHFAERLLTLRARHLDQSTALSELTEGGIAGSYAPAFS